MEWEGRRVDVFESQHSDGIFFVPNISAYYHFCFFFPSLSFPECSFSHLWCCFRLEIYRVRRGVKNVYVNTSRLRLWKTEKGEEGWLGKDQTGRKHAQRVCVPVLRGGGGGGRHAGGRDRLGCVLLAWGKGGGGGGGEL